MPEEILIQLKDVVKKFRKNIVLNGVNLNINNKDIYGIIGTSGSGKTTILNLIIGFLKATNGNISYNSKNISSTSAKENDSRVTPVFSGVSRAQRYCLARARVFPERNFRPFA